MTAAGVDQYRFARYRFPLTIKLIYRESIGRSIIIWPAADLIAFLLCCGGGCALLLIAS